ncbi:MAG: L,D-transpeptidase family protein [Hyphomicrobiales bacterium]|nr:L,D-transpeptidase family protein [Hyphomicrobiales bacterium]
MRRSIAPPIEIKKVSAPKYFVYNVSGLKKVNFAPLIALSSEAKAVDNTQTGVVNENQPATVPITSEITHFENQEFLDAAATLGTFDIDADGNTGKAIVAHYLANPDFFWLADGRPKFGTELVLDLFGKADDLGLMASDYEIELPGDDVDLQTLIQFEMNMSLKATRYALDARNGKINPNKLSGYHDFPKSKFTALQAIAEIASAISPSAYLAASSPGNAKFMQLRATLIKLRKESSDVITIAEGTLIKPGESHDELPNVIAAIRKKASIKLLQRHGEALTAYSKTSKFTNDLVALVKGFQKEVKLNPDGVVGRNTISRLIDLAPQVKMNRVRLAMERLRWHPRSLGSRHVFVNQPAYRAQYIQSGEEKLTMRVIVGKHSNQTSFFHDTIERVEYNPYWGVPQSIIINEMLPRLRADPSYLDRRGYEVTTLSGQQISSSSVDWRTVGGGVVPFNVRQYPGRKNALGELKILFPNRHAIYMHDTPSRGLFRRERRALSHGCVRLQNPRGMAAAVLGTTVSHVSSKVNLGKNNDEKLKVQIPVYIAYFTAWPDKDGEVEYFTDIYGRDKHLTKAISKVASMRGKEA